MLWLNILCKGWPAGYSSSKIFKNVCPIFVDTFLLNGGLYVPYDISSPISGLCGCMIYSGCMYFINWCS